MHDVDVVIFKADGLRSAVFDHYSFWHLMPERDNQQDYTAKVISVNNGRVNIEARRKLNTGDRFDFEFHSDQFFTVGYAYETARNWPVDDSHRFGKLTVALGEVANGAIGLLSVTSALMLVNTLTF